jgi:hypothetical protein
LGLKGKMLRKLQIDIQELSRQQRILQSNNQEVQQH